MSASATAGRRAAFCILVTACAVGSAGSVAGGDWNPHAVQADLIIEDAQLALANPNRLRVRVANRGLAPAVATQLTLVYHRAGKATPMAAPVPLLQAGERQWLIVEVGAPLAEADEVVLQIDEPPRVSESDEGNNVHRWSYR